jgi:apolipoprotein N-acyltransferase
MLRSLLALLAGACIPLSFSPFDWWPIGIAGVAMFYFCLANTTAREAGRLGFWFGCGLFGVGASWIYVSIHDYGYAPPPLAGLITLLFVIFMALYNAVQCWAWRRYVSVRTPVLGFAATWVACELFRSWFLTGFPWLFLGYAHVTTALSGLAPLFGVFGLSFMVALCGALLADWLMQLRLQRPALLRHRNLMVLVALGAMAAASNGMEWTMPSQSPPLSVGIVQGNIEQDVKFRPDALEQSLDTYIALTAPLWHHDLVVWPETAIPMLYQNADNILQALDAQARRNDGTFITGIFYRDGELAHNSMAAMGRGSGVWHKQKLVPFGEYIPLRELMGNVMQLFDLPMSSLAPGPASQSLLTANGVSIAPFICYEVVYPEFVRAYGKEAAILLTISNDTWFGASFGPLQHLQMAAMRARELGRYMVRATNNGVSALINSRGEIIARTEQFRAETLEGEVAIFEGRTPYSRWGSWPVLGLVLGTIVFNMAARTAQDQQQASP